MAAWQVTVSGPTVTTLVMGAETEYQVGPEGIAALMGTATVRSADVERTFAGGVVAGRDSEGARELQIPVTVIGDDVEDVVANMDTLRDTFAPTSAELTLKAELPGRDYVVVGRPRGVEVDMEGLAAGVAKAMCMFTATDPTLYTA